MPLSNIVNNIGVGKVEATMLNLTTTFAGASATPFTAALVDAYRRAASLLGNNYIGQGTTTFGCIGAVLALSENNQATKAFPERAVLQVAGFAEIQGTTGDAAPAVNAADVFCQRAGFGIVEQTPAAAHVPYRGIVTEVFDTDRLVVLF